MTTCFAPLLRWIVRLWGNGNRQMVLALGCLGLWKKRLRLQASSKDLARKKGETMTSRDQTNPASQDGPSISGKEAGTAGSDAASPHRLAEVIGLFLRLGFTAFGGPPPILP